jgi:hypothetical protein
MLIATGTLFAAGVLLFLYDFFLLAPRPQPVRNGLPEAARTPA